MNDKSMREEIEKILDEYLGSSDNFYEPKVRKDCSDQIEELFTTLIKEKNTDKMTDHCRSYPDECEHYLVHQYESRLLAAVRGELVSPKSKKG